MEFPDNPLAGPWIDVSRPLTDGTPVWPGDRAFVINQQKQPDFVLSSFATTCHVGTHVDAPLHLDASGTAAHSLPLDVFLGPAEVITVDASSEAVTVNDLPPGWHPAAPRVLIRTDSHPLGADIGPGFAGLSSAVVEFLAQRGVRLVGIDAPSMDAFDDEELSAHHELLRRNMVWIEGLWLAGASSGLYLMVALPLQLVGTEATPVRVLLRSQEALRK